MSEEKENADIFSKPPDLKEEDDSNSPKKGYILIGISLLLIFIALIITLFFVFKLNEDEGKKDESPTDNYPTEEEKQNLIKAKYSIQNELTQPIFYHTFKDYIEKIKVNDIEMTLIDNVIKFNKTRIYKIKIKLNANLTNLDSLFYQCHSLEEVDLRELKTSEIISATDTFNGCKNLKKIIFGNFEAKDLSSIANMFSGCEKLSEVNISFFK